MQVQYVPVGTRVRLRLLPYGDVTGVVEAVSPLGGATVRWHSVHARTYRTRNGEEHPYDVPMPSERCGLETPVEEIEA